MFAVAIFAATLVLGILHTVTSRSTLSNRDRLLEALRMAGLTVVWGIVATEFIGLLLPSAWS